ncbi:MAG: ABC transporter substrate-binding protein [Nitrososphaerota archaeon]|nr:ABC transporter substrate-binding protein [Nitrososphaerota archaeon]
MFSRRSAMRAISRTVTIVAVVVVIVIIAVSGYVLLSSPTSTTTSTSSASSTSSTQPISTTSTSSTSSGATPVSFELDFAPNSYHALWYYTLDQGIYTQNRLSVDIIPGSSPANTVSAVASGTADFGIASLVSVIAAESHGVSNVRVIGVVYHSNPDTVFFIQGKGINTLQDLAGKTFGTFTGSAAAQELPTLLKQNGVNYSTITISQASPATLPSLLISGKVDFIALTANRISDIGAAAQQNGEQLGHFFYKDYGLNRYDLVLLTNTNMIQNHSQIVQEFVNASYYGQMKAMQNPAAAAQSIVNHFSSLNYTITLQGLQIAINESVAPVPAQYTSNPLYLGWINQTEMQQSVNLIKQSFNITATIDVAGIYTNQYVAQPP